METLDIAALLGYSNNAKIMMETFRSSSNVILTDNPEYKLETFKKTFRIFDIQSDDQEELGEKIPIEVFNLFVGMAQKSIKYDRYKSQWEYIMGLYVAHNLVLYLRTQSGIPGSADALKGSLPIGIASSKSVDGLSISYDFMGMNDDFSEYGTWKLTTYGQQLITLTKAFGHGGMWVNW